MLSSPPAGASKTTHVARSTRSVADATSSGLAWTGSSAPVVTIDGFSTAASRSTPWATHAANRLDKTAVAVAAAASMEWLPSRKTWMQKVERKPE